MPRPRRPRPRARSCAAYLQPQPDDTRAALRLRGASGRADRPDAALARRHPRHQRAAPVAAGAARRAARRAAGPRTVHLDIVDYPGEWLLDLALMDKIYRRLVGGRAGAGRAARLGARPFLAALRRGRSCGPSLRSRAAQALAAAFTAYLQGGAARRAIPTARRGGSCCRARWRARPALTFAPLPAGARRRAARSRASSSGASRPTSARWCKPFFRDHFARIDRQVVLVDVLGAIHAGPPAMEDLRRAMADILARLPARAEPLAEPGSCWAGGSRRSCSPRPRPTTCTIASIRG